MQISGVFLSVIFTAFLLRVIAILIHKKWFKQGLFGDSSIHFMIIKQLKKDFFSKYIEQYLISPEPMSYPTGFHRFTSLFSLDLIRKYPYLPNLAIFVMGSTLFAVYLHYIEIKYFDIDDYRLTFYGSVFYFSLITNWYFYGPNIAYIKLSERLAGRMGTSFYFLFSFVSIFYLDNYSFVLASLAGGLVLISSIFSRQVLIFVTIIQALLLWSWQPFLILLLSITVALLLSKDHFIRGMRHTVIQWKLHKTHTKKSKMVLSTLTGFFSLKDLKGKKIFGKIFYLANKEPFRVMLFLLEIPFLIILTLVVDQGLGSEIWLYIGSIFVVYLLTSLEYFNHLGEAYRYPEYSLYFLLPLLLSLVLIQNNVPIVNVWTISYFIGITIVLSLYFSYIKQRINFPSRDVLSDFLKKIDIPNDVVIYPISMRLGGDICSRGEYKSFWWQPGIISTEIYDKYIEEYPYLKKEWQTLFDEYAVKFVMVDKKALLNKEKVGIINWKYDFSKLIFLYEDTNFMIYKIDKTQ